MFNMGIEMFNRLELNAECHPVFISDEVHQLASALKLCTSNRLK